MNVLEKSLQRISERTHSTIAPMLLETPCARYAQGRCQRTCGLESRAVFPSPMRNPILEPMALVYRLKYTKQDTWLAVGNSIFEGMRDRNVEQVYVLLGKTVCRPEVKWGQYEECVTNVRVSNSTRFVLEMGTERSSLFEHLSVKYDHIRKDERSREDAACSGVLPKSVERRGASLVA